MAVPEGIIAIWTGTIANIPANWNICDGNNSTPNLLSKFIKGAPDSTEAGSTGGSATHGHSSMDSGGVHSHTCGNGGSSHRHDSETDGSHNHQGSFTSRREDGYTVTSSSHDGGGHEHGYSSYSDWQHSHTVADSSGHTHTVNDANNEPSYYEVAFIQAASSANLANGIIFLWAEPLIDIPSGWLLCDGDNSTPDLKEKFLKGVASAVTDPGNISGNATHLHTINSTGSHSHSLKSYGASHKHTYSEISWSHGHTVDYVGGSGSSAIWIRDDTEPHDHTSGSTNGNHTHNTNSTGSHSDHSVEEVSNLPPYYNLAHIMNNGSSDIPWGLIMMWNGLIVDIPEKYHICDGTEGTPDLREKFVRGSPASTDPGDTGGSSSHDHDVGSGGVHSHSSVTTSGGHTHGSNYDGNHSHSYNNVTCGTGSPYTYVMTSQSSDGSHSHESTSAGGHSNHSIGDSDSHTHGTTNTTSDVEPPYYEILYIMKVTPRKYDEEMSPTLGLNIFSKREVIWYQKFGGELIEFYF